MTDYDIATKLIEFYDMKVVKESAWHDYMEPFLKEHITYSAFALSVQTWGYRNIHEVYNVCSRVVQMPQ